MRFHKLERTFFVLIVLMFGIGLLLYQSQIDIGQLQTLPLDVSASTLMSRLDQLSYTTIWVLFAALVCGVFLIYPTIRTNAPDGGKLQIVARGISKRSQTFEYAALTDRLTGMQNRHYFDEALKEYLHQFGRIQRPVGLMIIELDHFKTINDTYGHEVGDMVLQAVARCLEDHTRYHDVIARLDGEQFAVLAPNMDAGMMIKLANRICNAISALEIDVGDGKLVIAISTGVTIWDRCETSNDFYERAVKMLGAAKNSGRNRVCA